MKVLWTSDRLFARPWRVTPQDVLLYQKLIDVLWLDEPPHAIHIAWSVVRRLTERETAEVWCLASGVSVGGCWVSLERTAAVLPTYQAYFREALSTSRAMRRLQ